MQNKGFRRCAALLLACVMVGSSGGIMGNAQERPIAPEGGAGQNLLRNGSFETNSTSGWTEAADGAFLVKEGFAAPDGSRYLESGGGAEQVLEQKAALAPLTKYVVTGWVRAEEPGRCAIGVKGFDSENPDARAYRQNARTDEWEEVSLTFTTDEKGEAVIYIAAGEGGQADGIVLRPAGADTTTLARAVAQAGEALERQKETGARQLSPILEEAGRLLADKAASQAEVDAMAAELSSALARAASAEAGASAPVYYLDAETGNDQNNGTSPQSAWKSLAKIAQATLAPGSQVLLKRGSVWNGEQLRIENASGTGEQPIVIGAYGEGSLPVLNGQGSDWGYTRKEESGVVYLYNSSHVVVENLEVTNLEEEVLNEGAVVEQSNKLLSGIVVENRDAGELSGITIRNNVIHDVNSKMMAGGDKGTGGINISVTGSQTKSWFNGLTISGNELYNVCHEGIYLESSWGGRKLVNTGFGGASNWVGSKNVRLDNNYLHHIAGDGIVVIGTEDAVAEYNLLEETASEDWNYSRNIAHAAIWMWNANNVTMQYNEVFDTQSTKDGMAFDFDYGVQNALYQYNYSHNNKGGFLMVCPGPNYTMNCVGRYNLSVNDALFNGSRILRIGEYGSKGIQLHNNTMYWDHNYNVDAVEQATWGTPPSSGTDIYNNIFCGNSNSFAKNSGVTYSNNCLYGTVADAYPLDSDPGAVVADPEFVDVADFTSGSFQNGKVTLGRADGFRLKATSPCLNAGKELMPIPRETLPGLENDLASTNIAPAEADYYGNPLTYGGGVDIGIYEHQGEAVERENDPSYLNELLALAESYAQQKDRFVASSYTAFEAVVQEVNSEKTEDMTYLQIAQLAGNLERAFGLLRSKDVLSTPETAENLLNENQSGFENGNLNGWSPWPSGSQYVQAVKTEAYEGEYAVKMNNNGATQWAELMNLAVSPNTEYVAQAYVKAEEASAGAMGLDAKHHKDYTDDKTDHKLGGVSLEEGLRDGQWHKVSFALTTENYNKISLILTNDSRKTMYVDAILLYEKYGKALPQIDVSALREAVAGFEEADRIYYTAASWDVYKRAVAKAKAGLWNVFLTQAGMEELVSAVREAFDGLVANDGPADEADINRLKTLYYNQKNKTAEDYTAASWEVFQAALDNAKAVLDGDSLTQNQVLKAYASLESAARALVNRSTLKIVLDLANAHKEAGEVDELVPSAKEQFMKALAAAQAIYDKPDASQAETDGAWKNLMNVIHALGFLPGDKAELTALVEQAGSLNLSGYEDGAEKDAFAAALQAARDLIADKDAMKEDLSAAYKALDEAMKNLIHRPAAGDKTELKKVIAIAAGYDMSNYVDDVDAKKAFADALQAAREADAKDGARQDEIDAAKGALLAAMTKLRLRADKASLNEWLDALKEIDLTQYTGETANVVREVIARAEALAAMDLGKEQTALIEAMIAEMENARAQLVPAPAGPAPANPEEPGAESGASQESPSSPPNGIVPTGDASGRLLPLMAGAALGLGALLVYKKQRKANSWYEK